MILTQTYCAVRAAPCSRVFCGHKDWIEGLMVCQARETAYDQSFLSYSADGHVACWELDAEQNCDIFRLVVSVGLTHLHSSSALSVA
jgi:hypothetical protein